LSAVGTETAPSAGKAAESGPARSAGSAPALRLTGIVWSEDPAGRYAVVNGAIISEGAEIQGIKVVEILPNRVRLLDRGRPFELQLF
jgi:general secretion pathway protein B